MVPPSSKYEGPVSYSVSREVPCSVLKCETVLGTLDATPKFPHHPGLTEGEHGTQSVFLFHVLRSFLSKFKSKSTFMTVTSLNVNSKEKKKKKALFNSLPLKPQDRWV